LNKNDSESVVFPNLLIIDSIVSLLFRDILSFKLFNISFFFSVSLTISSNCLSSLESNEFTFSLSQLYISSKFSSLFIFLGKSINWGLFLE